jgi:hypothetical protein
MSKTAKIIVYFLVFDVIVLGFYFGIKSIAKSSGKSPLDNYEWKTMDASYQAADFVEQFIKDDAAQKNIFPVQIRNFKQSPDVLKRFVGKNFARSSPSNLDLVFPGLDDWALIQIKYKNEKEQVIDRVVLYVSLKGQWRVGDSGTLMQ